MWPGRLRQAALHAGIRPIRSVTHMGLCKLTLGPEQERLGRVPLGVDLGGRDGLATVDFVMVSDTAESGRGLEPLPGPLDWHQVHNESLTAGARRRR